MEKQKRPVCPDNDDLALYMWNKRQEMAEPNGISERLDSTLNRAYSGVCAAKTPIKTLKDFSDIKGVGKWTVRLMQGFFKTDSAAAEVSDPEGEDLSQKEKTKKSRGGPKRYVPQKKSAAYALLITLYRGTRNEKAFMRKQELIDEAEASGLSRVPIGPELGKGKLGHPGSSAREWYCGWNTMKTLITKGLVVKSSNPAKYMLTQEGQEAAADCLLRSDQSDAVERFTSEDTLKASDLEYACTNLPNEGTAPSVNLSSQQKSRDVPNGVMQKFTSMGYSVQQIHVAFAKVSHDSQTKDASSLLPAVLHHLQKDQVDVLLSECRQTIGINSHATRDISNAKNGDCRVSCEVAERDKFSNSPESTQSSFNLRGCSSSDYSGRGSVNQDSLDAKTNALVMPPLKFGERFEDVYDVILILDDREQFTNRNKGTRSRRIVESICSEFKIQIEVRRLPVGDGIWIAQHKYLGTEYVLDFIVERKGVDDLRCSIRDNRYRDQKLRLLRCGLQKLIFLVEGDPNSSDAAESIKTACFTTEILEGFDVQRTSGLGDTLRKYGYLTLAITHCYREFVSSENIMNVRICPSFNEFTKKCQDLEKMTASDVFAIQLMQVPQVTEEVAVAVLGLYPTLISLAHAYASLEGDTCAQEEMLKNQSNNLVSGAASKNIFQLVWGS